MPTESIDFSNHLESGDEVLSGASPQAMNVVVDKRGTILRRPGISAYSEAPTTSVDSFGVNGLHTTLEGELYAVGVFGGGTRKLYRVKGGSANDYSTSLSGDDRANFAETEALLTLTGGQILYKVVKETKQLDLLGGNPPECSHVVANSSRLLANDVVVDKTKVNFSSISQGNDTTGNETWDRAVPGETAGFFTAEARPDPVVAIAESTNDIFVFGSTNLQLFSPDTALIYAPTNTREYGLIAPYSVIKVDQAFAWLDHRRRFVISDGRNFDDRVGDPIQATINGLARVDDCFGHRVRMDQFDCMVWTFPSAGMTFCFQQGAGWSQWQGWDSVNSNWKQHQVLSHNYRSDTDTNVVGLLDGRIAQYDASASDDLGELMPASVTTGFLDRGTDRRKKCDAVHIAISRGTSTTVGDDPIGFLSYADSPGHWRGRIPLHLGVADDTDPVITLRSLGWYRRRQWKFEFSNAQRLALVSVTESFTVLEP